MEPAGTGAVYELRAGGAQPEARPAKHRQPGADPAKRALDLLERAPRPAEAGPAGPVAKHDRRDQHECQQGNRRDRDEQQRILELILKPRLQRVEASVASIYEDQASLLHFLSQTGMQRPAALTMAATFAINAGLRRALEAEPLDAIQLRLYLGLAQSDKVELEKPLLRYIADRQMKQAMVQLQKEVVIRGEHQTSALENALFVARTLTDLPFERNLWQAQNIWYDVYRHLHEAAKQAATTGSQQNGDTSPAAEARRAAAGLPSRTRRRRRKTLTDLATAGTPP